MHAAKLTIVHIVLAGFAYALWRAGGFAALPSLGYAEIGMLLALVAYSLPGFVALYRQRWDVATHVANGIPMWALCFTVLGMLLSVAQMRDLTSDALGVVFRNLAYSIAPNMVGVALMAWLREMAWWFGRERV